MATMLTTDILRRRRPPRSRSAVARPALRRLPRGTAAAGCGAAGSPRDVRERPSSELRLQQPAGLLRRPRGLLRRAERGGSEADAAPAPEDPRPPGVGDDAPRGRPG